MNNNERYFLGALCDVRKADLTHFKVFSNTLFDSVNPGSQMTRAASCSHGRAWSKKLLPPA